MSRLENDAKPTMLPLLQGASSTLTPTDQTLLARWATKTAMVAEGFEVPEHYIYTQTDRVAMREDLVIPPRTSIWLATSSEHNVFLTEKSEHRNARVDPDAKALCTTLVFGRVVLQVFSMKLSGVVPINTSITTEIRKGPWFESTVSVWPVRQGPITWPLARELQGEQELDLFASRFRTSALDASQSSRIVI